MAASIPEKCVRLRISKFSAIFNQKHCFYSTPSTNLETVETDSKNEEKLKDISRMPNHLKPMMRHRLAMPRILFDYQLEDRYQRKLYGKFGKASGVDPSICWPTKKELGKMVEEDRVFEPKLEESMARLKEKREEERITFETRQKKIEANMASLSKWMADLQKRKDKKLAEVNQAKLKKERLIEEVRQYFGYRLNPKDPKFQEILDKKEKEEKKAAKEMKKKEKFNKEMAKLAALAQIDNQKATPVAEKTKEPDG